MIDLTLGEIATMTAGTVHDARVESVGSGREQPGPGLIPAGSEKSTRPGTGVSAEIGGVADALTRFTSPASAEYRIPRLENVNVPPGP